MPINMGLGRGGGGRWMGGASGGGDGDWWGLSFVLYVKSMRIT